MSVFPPTPSGENLTQSDLSPTPSGENLTVSDAFLIEILNYLFYKFYSHDKI
jgi:hypothetical protein